MSVIDFSFDIGALLAANLFASKEKARPYLQGVLLETLAKENKGLFTATGEHALISIPFKIEAAGDVPSLRVIIPSSLIEKIRKDKKRYTAKISIKERGEKPALLDIAYAGAVYSDGAVDGSFPEYRLAFDSRQRVIGHQENRIGKLTEKDALTELMNLSCENHFTFNADYMVLFAKANRLLGLKTGGVTVSQVRSAAREPVLVRPFGCSDLYTGLLMPLK